MAVVLLRSQKGIKLMVGDKSPSAQKLFGEPSGARQYVATPFLKTARFSLPINH